MIKISNTEIYNLEGAIRGMRNPLNSWSKSDSGIVQVTDTKRGSYCSEFIIGKNDLKLAQKLILAGTDHSKFLRQIFVSVDITAPIYLWKELDTYKVGTVSNSTSTMHKLASSPIQASDFSFEAVNDVIAEENSTKEITKFIRGSGQYHAIINMCETLREKYNKTGDMKYWKALIQILPQGYNQTRTWTANYAVLRNIYFSRRYHKLSEWHQFCEWIEELKYGKQLICYEKEDK